MSDENAKGVVCWQRAGGPVFRGLPIGKRIADAMVASTNKIHPDIHHWVEDWAEAPTGEAETRERKETE